MMEKMVLFLCAFLWPTMKAMETSVEERQNQVLAKVQELVNKHNNIKYKFRVWGLEQGKATLSFIIMRPKEITHTENSPVVEENLLLQIGVSYNSEAKQPDCQQWSILKKIIHHYQKGTWKKTESFRSINPWDKNDLEGLMPRYMKAAINYLKKTNELPKQSNTTINWEIKHFSDDWEILGQTVTN